MSAITGRPADDRALEQLLGEAPVRCQPTRWGFDASTRLVTLAAGRSVVMQVRDTASGMSQAATIRAATDTLHAAGIAVPRLIGAPVSEGRELLVFDLVAGRPGPELLGDPVRGPALARAMGRLIRSLAATPIDLVATDAAWATPQALRQAAQRWLDGLVRGEPMGGSHGAVAHPVPRTITEAVAPAITEMARSPWTVVVTHGDYVPANVLVADDGSLTLLDLGSVAGRHPALDAAWWALILRHHHARVAPALVAAMRVEAWPGATGPNDRLLASLALVRAVQLAAEREAGPHRRHLLDLAASAVSWSESMPLGG